MRLRIGAFTLLGLGVFAAATAQTIDPAHLGGLKWRNIGPFRGGRVSAVAGVSSQPDTFYIGLPQGGVWKTTSAGQTWHPIFDKVKGVSTVGSVQVAPSNPNTVYAGTGEISGSGEGNGVYRSLDAGKTWTHIGLEDSKIVASMLVDPHNPKLVLASALGSSSSLSKQRGVFRSTDGGDHWTRALNIDDSTGVQHITWAYDNPKVVYAESWQRYVDQGPKPTTFKQPGPDAIYKSTDEGATWKKLSPVGLPRITGRVTLAVAMGTNSQRLFLIGTFGLYRSDDGGEHWRQMAKDDSRIANGQGYYSSGVYVDSKNPDVVYTLATCVFRSRDGGKTFEGLKGAPGGDDPHFLWIDPANGNHILLGGDQGATVSLDAGKTWGSWYNQPTGQVYHVSTDNQFPYWVYATQQDSGCIGTASRGNLGAITPMDWLPHPGNEGGYVIVDPLNPKISYAVGPVGGIIKVTYPSGTWIQVEPNMGQDGGFGGSSGQMEFSPTNPHELLMSSKHMLSTTDGALHWNELGPDLAFDPDANTPDQKRRSQFSSISSFSPSPLAKGMIWAATSNGFVKVTRDHGATWADVSIQHGIDNRGRVYDVEASGTDAAGAYALVYPTSRTAGKAKMYRTHDFGQTWTEMGKDVSGEEQDSGYLNVLRSDPARPGLLYGLKAREVMVSFDDGDHWQSLKLNLPTTQMSDLRVKGTDLVLGTYGRGIWILDDVAPLRQLSAATVAEDVHLFKPTTGVRLRRNVNGDTPFPPEVPHAKNPPLGSVIYYSLAHKPTSNVMLEIVDSHGTVVRHMSSDPIEPYDDPAPPVPSYWVEVRKPMPANVGLNRVNWNIRYDTPLAFNHDVGDVMGAMKGDTPAAIEGPLALPGAYTARLIVDGKTYTQTFEVVNDPRSTATRRDLEQEHQLRLAICAGVQETWDGYHQALALRTAVSSLRATKPAPPEIDKLAVQLDSKLEEVAGTITRERRFYGPPPPTSFVNLNGFLLARLDSFDYGDVTPTPAMLGAYGADWLKLKKISDEWRGIQKTELAKLNQALAKAGKAPLVVSGKPVVDPPAPAARYIPKVAPATRRGNSLPDEDGQDGDRDGGRDRGGDPDRRGGG